MSERLFGAKVRRREDLRLITGRGQYVADLALPGMLHVAVHRRPHAHARIARIDASAARARSGVGTFASRVAVLAGASALHAAREVRQKALAIAAERLAAGR